MRTMGRGSEIRIPCWGGCYPRDVKDGLERDSSSFILRKYGQGHRDGYVTRTPPKMNSAGTGEEHR
jgi:hypothetical protein